MKQLVVILAIALVALGGGAIHIWRQHDADRQQIADLQARLQEMQTAQQAAAAALARQAQAFTNKPEPAASPGAPAAPKVAASSPVSAQVDEMMKQMTDPEGRDVRRAQRRMLLPQLYPNIGKWLNLTRDEENKLLDLIAKQESNQSEAYLDPANRNNPAAQQETARKVAAQRQADDAEVAALLGSKYPQFQEYRQTTGVHRQVGQLQAMLGSGAEGLNDAQSRSLTTALVAEQVRINQERSSAPPATQNAQDYMQQQIQRTAENNRRLLQVAATQLNAQQLESYRKMLEQQERTSSSLLRTLGNAGAAAPATGQ